MKKAVILIVVFICAVLHFSSHAAGLYQKAYIPDVIEIEDVPPVDDEIEVVTQPSFNIVVPVKVSDKPIVEPETTPIGDVSEPKLKSLGTFSVTAYCSCRKCCGKWSPEVTGKPSYTASGTRVKAGRTIAVDPNVIPLGTKVLIDNNEYTAEDTGSGVNGNHIDIYFDSHRDARNFGLQKKEVFVYY